MTGSASTALGVGARLAAVEPARPTLKAVSPIKLRHSQPTARVVLLIRSADGIPCEGHNLGISDVQRAAHVTRGGLLDAVTCVAGSGGLDGGCCHAVARRKILQAKTL